MSKSAYLNLKPVPFNSSTDYQFRKNTDSRRYEKLSDLFLEQQRCTFPIEMLSSGFNVVDSFDPCDKTVTFKIPPTRGTGWHLGSANQRYKDLDTPMIEYKTFPLWTKLWTQYKIDKYEFMCADTQDYKMQLDDVNMKDLNDQLLGAAITLLGSYNTDFCGCNGTVGTQTAPLHFVEGESTPTEFLFDKGNTFSSNCLPSDGFMSLFPLCTKSLFLRDEAINKLYNDCCRDIPPSLSGMWPDFIRNINGVSPVFIKDEFFDTYQIDDDHIAYKIPTFHADAFAYQPALLDSTEIGEDKEEDGRHFRRSFFFSMNVVHENFVTNDWVVFSKSGLPVYTSPEAV